MPELPAVQSELPTPPEPYPYLRVGHVGTVPLPEGVGAAVDLTDVSAEALERELRRGLDLVTLSTSGSTGPSGALTDAVLAVLTACEAEGVPTVLRAQVAADLESPLAAVASHAVTEERDLHGLLLRRYGSERVLLLESTIEPQALLLEDLEDPEALTPERIARRRELIASRCPAAQASRLLRLLGMPAEPEPLVTALIVSRRAENLNHTLENLRRQVHPRIEPLVVIDPLYESEAREATAGWDVPLRIHVANPRSTLADRLNLGAHYAAGQFVAVIEESALYGPHHLTDLLQAAQHSGAHLVGKASWFVKDDDGSLRVRAPKLQRTFGEVPALGTVLMPTDIARRIGFTRRAAGINRALAERALNAGGTIFSIHAYDTVLLRGGQTIKDLSVGDLQSAALPDLA